MKINIPSGLNPVDVIRRCGYGSVLDRHATEPSFARHPGRGLYPRFHVYISGNTLNMHLDQKQVSYEGSSRHSGEYEGDAVEREAQRMQGIIEKLEEEMDERISEELSEKPRGFFSKLFGKKE
jgi:hypothetical protein